MKKLAVGIDIGGTNTEIGLVDAEGNVLIRSVISTTKYNDVDNFVAYVAEEINNIGNKLKETTLFELVGIGIGAPAANLCNGTIDNVANLPWKGIVPIVAIFRRHFPNIPITLTNDAKGAAMGELIYGGARGLSDLIFITLGTGVGSAIVSDGHLIYGQEGFAGEIGHSISIPNGRECGCGRRGCLDVYASAGGVKRTAFELLAELRSDSALRSYSFNELTSEIIHLAALNGDAIAKEVFERTGKILGLALANASTVTFPQVIFLFGGLAKAGDMLLEPTKRSFEENLLINYKGKIDIRFSELNNNNATILGASSMIWAEFRSN